MGPRIGDGNGGTAPAEARGYGRGCDILILMKPGKPVLGTDGTHAEADGLRERYRQGPQNVYLTWSFEDASDWDAEDVVRIDLIEDTPTYGSPRMVTICRSRGQIVRRWELHQRGPHRMTRARRARRDDCMMTRPARSGRGAL